MLDDGRRRPCELLRHAPGGVKVYVVIITHFLLTAELGQGHWRVRPAVEAGALMRILAVAQHLREIGAQRQYGGESIGAFGLATQPGGNRGVVRGGVAESLQRQMTPRLDRHGLAFLHVQRHGQVVLRIAQHRYRLEILGRGPQQRDAANINLLDGLGLGDIGAGHGTAERIQVAYHQVKRLHPLLAQISQVLRGATSENAAMNRRVQGFDATAQHLRKMRDLFHRGARQIGLRQGARGAAAGNQLHPVCTQHPRQVNQAGFVMHA